MSRKGKQISRYPISMSVLTAVASTCCLMSFPAQAAPAYVVSRGVIPYDEWATNTPQITPKRTALNSTGSQDADEKNPHSYSYDTIVEVRRGSIDSGTAVVHYELDNPSKKEWFSGIFSVKLVASDGEGVIQELSFEKRTEDDGRDGIITIDASQKGFEQVGIYYVRAESQTGEQKIVTPIQFVDAKGVPIYGSVPDVPDEEDAPRIIINQRLPYKAGERLAFQIPEMEDLEENPIKKLSLTRPDGTTIELQEGDGYTMTYSVLYIYGTGKESGKVYAPYSGIYRINIEAEGFKNCSKKFRVEDGANVEESQKTRQAMTYDAVSRASAGGSGGAGGDGWPGYVVFDEDLLSNAMILEKLGKNFYDADHILRNWRSYIPEYAASEGLGDFYSYMDFTDKASDASAQNEVLTFEEYRPEGMSTSARPERVQVVLETGALGKDTPFETIIGEKAPLLTSEEAVTRGTDFKLSCADKKFLAGITHVFVNATEPLDEQLYKIDADNGTLILRADAFSEEEGDINLRIYSNGYRESTTTLQFDLKIGDIVLKTESAINYVGEEVRIIGMTPQFVSLVRTERLNNRYLTWKDLAVDTDGKTLILKSHLFQEAKPYKLVLTAEGYEQPITLDFDIQSDEMHPEPEKKEVPKAEKIGLDYYGNELEVEFTNDDAAYEYTKALAAVSLNGEPLQNTSSDLKAGQFEVTGRIVSLYVKDALQDVNEVVFEADGYETWTFKVDEYGNVTDRNPGDPIPQKEPAKLTGFYDSSALELTFEDASYTRAITEVKVEGRTLSPENGEQFFGPDEASNSWDVREKMLRIGTEWPLRRNAADKPYAKVEITAKDYEDLTLAVKMDYYHIADVKEGWDDAWNAAPVDQEPPAAPSVDASSSWLYPSRWTFRFEEFEDSYYWYSGIFAANGALEINDEPITRTSSDEPSEGEAYIRPDKGWFYVNKNDFNQDINIVRIMSDTYRDLVFYVTREGEVTDQAPEIMERPDVPEQPEQSLKAAPIPNEEIEMGIFDSTEWTIRFIEGEELSEWLSGIFSDDGSFTINGRQLQKSRYESPDPGYVYFRTDKTYLYVREEDFDQDINEVVISSAGYSELIFYVMKEDGQPMIYMEQPEMDEIVNEITKEDVLETVETDSKVSEESAEEAEETPEETPETPEEGMQEAEEEPEETPEAPEEGTQEAEEEPEETPEAPEEGAQEAEEEEPEETPEAPEEGTQEAEEETEETPEAPEEGTQEMEKELEKSGKGVDETKGELSK